MGLPTDGTGMTFGTHQHGQVPLRNSVAYLPGTTGPY